MSAVLNTRVLGLLACDLAFDPSEDANKARARVVARDAEAIRSVTFSSEHVAPLLRWAVLMGFALAELIWDTGEGDEAWQVTLKPWHPSFVYYNLITRKYGVYTENGVQEITPGDGKWFLYAPSGPYRAWIQGAVRSCAIPWLGRQYAFRDWLRYCEMHGLPMRKVKVPTDANDPEKQALYGSIMAMGSAAVLQLPQNADGTGWDVELLEATDGSWKTFQAAEESCNTKFAIAILGQNLSTEVQGGSFAAAKVHGNVRQDYLEADAQTLAQAFRSQVLKPWAEYNYGDPNLAPHPRWETAPPEDLKAKSDMLVQLGTALTAFAQAAPDIDVRTLLEGFDLPLRTQAEMDAAAPPPPVPGAPGGPLPPNGNAPTPPNGPAPVAGPPPGVPVLNSRASGTPRAAVQAQLYVDSLADKTTAHATQAFRPDVDQILLALNQGADFDDVRRHLLASYSRAPHPHALEQLAEKATTAATLAGHHAVDLETGGK